MAGRRLRPLRVTYTLVAGRHWRRLRLTPSLMAVRRWRHLRVTYTLVAGRHWRRLTLTPILMMGRRWRQSSPLRRDGVYTSCSGTALATCHRQYSFVRGACGPDMSGAIRVPLRLPISVELSSVLFQYTCLCLSSVPLQHQLVQ